MGLSLTRYIGERLIINDNIIVTVLASKGRYMRVGIDALKQIPIHRDDAKVVTKKQEVIHTNNGIGLLPVDINFDTTKKPNKPVKCTLLHIGQVVRCSNTITIKVVAPLYCDLFVNAILT